MKNVIVDAYNALLAVTVTDQILEQAIQPVLTDAVKTIDTIAIQFQFASDTPESGKPNIIKLITNLSQDEEYRRQITNISKQIVQSAVSENIVDGIVINIDATSNIKDIMKVITEILKTIRTATNIAQALNTAKTGKSKDIQNIIESINDIIKYVKEIKDSKDISIYDSLMPHVINLINQNLNNIVSVKSWDILDLTLSHYQNLQNDTFNHILAGVYNTNNDIASVMSHWASMSLSAIMRAGNGITNKLGMITANISDSKITLKTTYNYAEYDTDDIAAGSNLTLISDEVGLIYIIWINNNNTLSIGLVGHDLTISNVTTITLQKPSSTINTETSTELPVNTVGAAIFKGRLFLAVAYITTPETSQKIYIAKLDLTTNQNLTDLTVTLTDTRLTTLYQPNLLADDSGKIWMVYYSSTTSGTSSGTTSTTNNINIALIPEDAVVQPTPTQYTYTTSASPIFGTTSNDIFFINQNNDITYLQIINNKTVTNDLRLIDAPTRLVNVTDEKLFYENSSKVVYYTDYTGVKSNPDITDITRLLGNKSNIKKFHICDCTWNQNGQKITKTLIAFTTAATNSTDTDKLQISYSNGTNPINVSDIKANTTPTLVSNNVFGLNYIIYIAADSKLTVAEIGSDNSIKKKWESTSSLNVIGRVAAVITGNASQPVLNLAYLNDQKIYTASIATTTVKITPTAVTGITSSFAPDLRLNIKVDAKGALSQELWLLWANKNNTNTVTVGVLNDTTVTPSLTYGAASSAPIFGDTKDEIFYITNSTTNPTTINYHNYYTQDRASVLTIQGVAELSNVINNKVYYLTNSIAYSGTYCWKMNSNKWMNGANGFCIIDPIELVEADITKQFRYMQTYISWIKALDFGYSAVELIATQPNIFDISFAGNAYDPKIWLTFINIQTLYQFKVLINITHSVSSTYQPVYDFNILANPKKINLKINNIYAEYLKYVESNRLNISIASLNNIIKLAYNVNTYDTLQNIANELWVGLQHQSTNSPELLKQLRNTLLNKQRNALLPLIVHTLNKGGISITNSRDLYNHLLIDVAVDAVVETSYIVEANTAVQLYINRCLNNLEPVTVEQELIDWWSWMDSYRMWQANRQVFLYPENYIEPELREGKTNIFKTLENNLQQVNLEDSGQVESVFNQYIADIAKIADLKVVSSALYDKASKDGNRKHLFMIGSNGTDPVSYYYMTAIFIKTGDNYVPALWGQWLPIDVQIKPIGLVTCLYAFGKWNIFWVENDQSGAEGSNNTPLYKITTYSAYLDSSNKWSAAQVMFYKDGLYSEPDQAKRTDVTKVYVEQYDTELYPAYFNSSKTLVLPYGTSYTKSMLPTISCID